MVGSDRAQAQTKARCNQGSASTKAQRGRAEGRGPSVAPKTAERTCTRHSPSKLANMIDSTRRNLIRRVLICPSSISVCATTTTTTTTKGW